MWLYDTQLYGYLIHFIYYIQGYTRLYNIYSNTIYKVVFGYYDYNTHSIKQYAIIDSETNTW